MRILFRPEARAEVLEAQTWYESRAVGLGLEFARVVDAAVSSAARNPEAFAYVAGSCRRLLLRKFPFSLVFRVRGDQLLVIAVFHHRRNPTQLTQRTGR
ncbi:type II toxin-antitoxin system RelE/ParE family toxin [Thermomonas carbonis]|uniref:Type II toxin-antitoxin system RelE/ParE family toxin n=2 Tax=Thermomonas carbonis TaxID=1463158 RepID=A0A7G9SND4_9GAMM|nr:type II toxin-antitoxin system RelE/ParE family toxin [Thermomonas carbonis]